MNKLLYRMNLRYQIVLFLILFLSSCASYQPGHLEEATRGFNMISQADEISVGIAWSRQFESKHRMITDPEVQNYINNLGQKLVRHSRRSNIPYQFKAVDTNEINARAYPGGFIYVNRGLIAACENEAELAGIIAHEIGHVAAKHGARDITKRLLINLGLTTLEGLTEEDKNQQLYLMLSQFVAQGFRMKYSRDDERQADDLAVETLYYAGYDPVAWVNFLARMERGNSYHFDLLRSTHPNTLERVRNVNYTLRTNFSQKLYSTDSPEFYRIRQRLGGTYSKKPSTRPSPSIKGMYGVWRLQWYIGMPYESVLVMKGKLGMTRTAYLDSELGQNVSIDQDMEFVSSSRGMFLIGSNPRFAGTNQRHSAYSPDNFALQQRNDGSFQIIQLCDQAGNCARVQSELIRSNPSRRALR